ncbi:MAG: thioredoxin domain-containing protein [Proteobacteria bacterium]|nr:thioredoxin domain-containing protein [Pseudomonadota bacterium]
MLSTIFIGSIFIYSACVAAPPDQQATGLMTSFGTGKIKVRLYSDYFCGPCRATEPRIEPIIKRLVQDNTINLTFIDAPFHKYSSLYARHFLFILKEKKDFIHALSVRALLFDMAKENLTETEKIEEYLKNKGVKIKPFDVKPLFSVFEGYLREDNIDSTPTCVIEHNGKKEIFKGGDNILKSLEGLKL